MSNHIDGMTWSFIFLIIGMICGLIGFASEPSPPAYLGRILFVAGLILFMIGYVHGWRFYPYPV